MRLDSPRARASSCDQLRWAWTQITNRSVSFGRLASLFKFVRGVLYMHSESWASLWLVVRLSSISHYLLPSLFSVLLHFWALMPNLSRLATCPRALTHPDSLHPSSVSVTRALNIACETRSERARLAAQFQGPVVRTSVVCNHSGDK